ncbi:MAG: ABC transporter permease [Candidatus Hydrogenedentes bacterium]|nr:ABC transporter permease [Candidatus Hydrogenedentota bacterium]
MKRSRKHSYWRLVGRQFRKNRIAVVACGVLVLFLGVALLGSFLAGDIPIYLIKQGRTYWFPNLIRYPDLLRFDFARWTPQEGEYALRPLVPYSPERSDLRNRLKGPSRDHLLGTDDRGRDVLSRLIHGTRISMSVGFVAVGIALIIGVIVGSVAGFYGGRVDIVVQRIIEIMMCFPTFILILSLIAFLPPSIYNIMIVIGITGWTDVARLVRGEFLKLRESDFATAARAIGLRDTRIMFRHLLPNALAPVWVSATFGVAGAILIESALSFLGFGVPPPTPSWGEILSQSKRYVDFAWWLVTFPGLAIFVTVTAFNLVGEGLRDAMDPRLRQ